MRKIALIGMVMVVLALSGCSVITGGTKIATVPPPADELRYEMERAVVDRATGETVIIPTDFTLLESPVRIKEFCAGCEADYYLKFWYVPIITENYTRTSPEVGIDTGVDSAVLGKMPFQCSDIRTLNNGIIPKWMNNKTSVDYLDSIYSLDFTDRNKKVIEVEATLEAQSFNPLTGELIISGFPQNETSYFSITYFHNENGKFNIYYVKSDPETPTVPGFALTSGFAYTPEAQRWVKLPGTQIVSPFMVRCAPVTLSIPEDATMPSKFEFCVGVTEVVSGTAGITVPRGLQERWQVSCREETN